MWIVYTSYTHINTIYVFNFFRNLEEMREWIEVCYEVALFWYFFKFYWAYLLQLARLTNTSHDTQIELSQIITDYVTTSSLFGIINMYIWQEVALNDENVTKTTCTTSLNNTSKSNGPLINSHQNSWSSLTLFSLTVQLTVS